MEASHTAQIKVAFITALRNFRARSTARDAHNFEVDQDQELGGADVSPSCVTLRSPPVGISPDQ